jgi:hypothetical protein
VDELSGDTMRVYDPVQKKVINQLELAQKLGLIQWVSNPKREGKTLKSVEFS